MDLSKRILVIIVTYQGTPWLGTCLSAFKDDREHLDILVIDNASADGTADVVRREYPFAEVWARPTNLGFGRANNLGIEKALAEGYRGVFLLNQDAAVSATTIRTLADRVDKAPEIGLASTVHYSDRVKRQLDKGFKNYLRFAAASPGSPHGFMEVPFVNAALWYIPMRTLLSVGLFCPLFEHYGEDLDFVNRLHSIGGKAGFFPDLDGYHLREEQPLNPKKMHTLDRAYRLTQLLNPALSPARRFIESVLKPALYAVTKENDLHFLTAREMWRLRPSARLWMRRPELDLAGLRRALARSRFAPVLLLVYNRPRHTELLLKDFFANPEAVSTPLYIIQDGGAGENWEEVRALCQKVAADNPLVTYETRETNLGLAENVTRSVSELLKEHGRIIVLEDDLELSPYFLRWMNDALDLYASVPEVAHLHAGTFYHSGKLPHNHLLRFTGSWGWATWRDRWEQHWEPDGLKLLRAIEAQPELQRRFDYGGWQRFSRMLRRQTMGENNSWAVRWHASILLKGLLSLNASPALVNNRGFDGTGVHSSGDDRYRTAVSPYPLYAEARAVQEENEEAYRILKKYYLLHNNKVVKGFYKVKELWRNLFG